MPSLTFGTVCNVQVFPPLSVATIASSTTPFDDGVLAAAQHVIALTQEMSPNAPTPVGSFCVVHVFPPSVEAASAGAKPLST
jgi:hypothetical protein